MKPQSQKIYLASKSPRRRELLRQIGVDFELLLSRDHTPRGPDVTEHILPDERAEDYVARVALEKAMAAQKNMWWRKLPVRPILAADTSVVLDGRVLGKPANQTEAADMMRAMSGRTHQVLTHIAVLHDEQLFQATQRSDVTFSTLSEQTIVAYCATADPYDKAGGYGIQGHAALFIQDITGSYSGIMGLPLFETGQLLEQAGLRTL